MSEHYPVRARDVAFRPFEDELLVVSAGTGRILSLNAVAGFVWDAVDGRRSVSDVVEMVCERYDVEPDTARADVAEVLGELAARGVLVLSETPVEVA